MKTKTFLLLFLFLGIGLTHLSAQSKDKNSENRAYSWWVETGDWIPIVCNGVTIDELMVTADYHQIQLVKNGSWSWIIQKIKFEGISIRSDEVFRNNELDKYNILATDIDGLPTEADVIIKIHLMGNMGSRYTCDVVAHLTLDSFDWTVVRSSCDFEQKQRK